MLSSCYTKLLVLISVMSGEVLFNHSWRSTCATSAGQICVPSQLSVNGAITLARMSFHLFSIYESGVIFLNWPNVPPNVFSPKFTECFPFVFRMFSVWFQNAFRIDRILSAC